MEFLKNEIKMPTDRKSDRDNHRILKDKSAIVSYSSDVGLMTGASYVIT